MNLYRLWRQSQKWTIAAAIMFGSTTIFTFWWITRSPQVPTVGESVNQLPVPKSEDNHPPETGSPVQAQPILASVGQSVPKISKPQFTIDAESMLISGKDLLQIDGDNITLIKKDWLSEAVRAGDEAIYRKEDNLLIISGSSDAIRVYQTDGGSIGNLTLPGGSRFDGYVPSNLSKAIYVKEGNIWQSKIDWPNAVIVQEEQLTNTGYFMGNPFKGRLQAATDKALLYRDHRYGLIHVNLETGATQTGQLPASRATGPEGRLVIGDLSTRPPQLVVYDINTDQDNYFPIPSRIPPNGLQWLGNQQAALVLRNHLYLYDHATQKLEQIYQTDTIKETLKPIAAPLQGEPYLFFQHSTKGMHLINTKTKQAHPIQGFSSHGLEMLQDGHFLLSSDVGNSDQRGTWLGKFGSPDLKRLFVQPIAKKYQLHRPSPQHVMTFKDDHAIIDIFDIRYLLNLKTTKFSEFPVERSELILLQASPNHSE